MTNLVVNECFACGECGDKEDMTCIAEGHIHWACLCEREGVK